MVKFKLWLQEPGYAPLPCFGRSSSQEFGCSEHLECLKKHADKWYRQREQVDRETAHRRTVRFTSIRCAVETEGDREATLKKGAAK